MAEPAAEVPAALDRALRAVQRGRLQEAFRIGTDLTRRFVDDARGWHLLSIVNRSAGRVPDAVRHAETAVSLSPRSAVYRVQLGSCLAMAGQINAALAQAVEAERLGVESPADLDAIGTIYSFCDNQVRALGFFEKAVAAEPSAHFLYNLATAQRMTGDLVAAEATCDRVIALDPHDYQAYRVRSDLRSYAADDNHIEEMMRLLASGTRRWQGEVLLRYAIAKECEDIGDYPRSFAHLKAGSDLQRAHMRYSVDDEIAVIDRIIRTHTADVLAGKAGAGSREPIFVLGLPRSGTTLIERILGRHDDVVSMGEIGNFPMELQKAVAMHTGSRRMPPLDMVEAAPELDYAALGDAYVGSTRPRTGRAARFVDKMPQNYLNCGLIHAALPDAKIIHVTRDPMDACYAVYKAYFSGTYPFSFKLEELGKYYLAYRRLMDHWREVLGDAMLDVRYEALVNDQQRETQRLLEYCGLAWQEECLHFHESVAPSTTASAVQVRQPIYRTSMGRWRCYASQLRPLQDIVAAG